LKSVSKIHPSHSFILGLKNISNRIKKLNVFNSNDVDRQGPLLITPFLAFVGFATAVAGLGVAQQTGIIDEIMEAANETMHYFDGIYTHYLLLYTLSL
jgi:hypothetical protein